MPRLNASSTSVRSQQRPVLVLQGDQLAVDQPGMAAGVLGQHQREQRGGLVLVGHQVDEQPAEPDRLLGQLRRRGAGVPLRVDQVDHREHAVEPLGEVRRVRHLVGDAGGRDPLLGAQQPLAHRRLRDQEHPGDLPGGEPGDHLEGQRHPGLHRERRVAAGEDETEAVVGEHAVLHCDLLGLLVELLLGTELGELGAFGAGPADHVEGPPLRGGGEPRGRVAGYAVARPGEQCPLRGIGDRVLGQVPVAGGADQGRDDPEPLAGHGRGERLADLVNRARHLLISTLIRRRGAAPVGR